MAPTTHTETHSLVFGQEVSFGSIVGPTDFLDVYVDGNSAPNAIVEWRVYATVGALVSLVGSAGGGGKAASVLQWVGQPSLPLRANGSNYELRAYWAQKGPAPTMKATIVGYDELDAVADSETSSTEQIPDGFGEITFATLSGYAQFADAAVAQNFSGTILFTLYALSEVGGVEAAVATQPIQQADGTTRIFRNLNLPGAIQYRLTARNLVGGPGPTITASLTCYSFALAASPGFFIAGNNLSGTSTSQIVVKINNASIPVAGALTPGNVLQVTGASALGYGPVNLAGGPNFVTGVLPDTNLPALAGDANGAFSSNVVDAINGNSVPPGPLTVGAVLRATGASALGYGQVDLANINAVTGNLPVGNVSPGSDGQSLDVIGSSNAWAYLGKLLSRRQTRYWSGGFTGTPATIAMNCAVTWSSSQTTSMQTTTNYVSSLSRAVSSFTSASGWLGCYDAAGGTAGGVWRGNGTGLGGFELILRFALETVSGASVFHTFSGLRGAFATPSNVIDWTTQTAIDAIGAGWSLTASGGVITGNWKIINNTAGSGAPTITDTGIPIVAGNLIELIITATPNSASVSITLNDLTASTTFTTTPSTNLPVNTTFLWWQSGFGVVSGGGATNRSSLVCFSLSTPA